MSKPFIGIKKIWYGEVIEEAVTTSSLATFIADANEVKNVHDGTWSYSQDDPNITEYINALTGTPYYRDPESNGAKTIAFTLGKYDFADKAELQGGSVVQEGSAVVGWKSAETPQLINKAVVAQTKSGNYIVFTNASIVGKVDTQEKNLGLGITAVAMENPEENVAAEYWFDGEAVSTLQTATPIS